MEKIKKIDAHAHAILFAQYEYPKHLTVTPEQLIDLYDKVGVEKGVLLPITSPEAQMSVITNEEVQAMVNQHPDRFTWFCNVDPRMGHNLPNEDLSVLLGHYKALGAKGMGELTGNLYADSPYVDNLFSHCEELDLPVTIHIAPDVQGYYGLIDDLGLPRLEKMLKKHPKLKVLGHSQGFWAEISADCVNFSRDDYPSGKVYEGWLAYLMRECENLYCDISAGSGCNAMTRDPEYTYKFIEEFGDRMLYGIDHCLPQDKQAYKLAAFLDNAAETGCISQEHYRGICRENAIRILKL